MESGWCLRKRNPSQWVDQSPVTIPLTVLTQQGLASRDKGICVLGMAYLVALCPAQMLLQPETLKINMETIHPCGSS